MTKTINNLYEYFKNTPKKLKIVCDWDEVIQACEPYALYLATKEKRIFTDDNFVEGGFKEFWNEESVEYSPYGSKLKEGIFAKDIVDRQQIIKNSPNFYQEAPFLTIAEDLLKLIKEDKIEQIIFLSAYDKNVFPNEWMRDERKIEIYSKTFGEVLVSHGVKESLQQIGFENEQKGQSKADWIKENASDFDLVIDDNPIICKEIMEKLSKMELLSEDEITKYLKESECEFCGEEVKREELGGFHHGGYDVLGIWEPIHFKCWKDNWGAIDNNIQFYNDLNYYLGLPITVIAPCYPAIAEQHDPNVLLVKQEVSNLKKEDFKVDNE